MAFKKVALACLFAAALASVSNPAQGRVLLESAGSSGLSPLFDSFVAAASSGSSSGSSSSDSSSSSSGSGVDLSQITPVVAICLPTALVDGVNSTQTANCVRANAQATGPSALPQQCFNILAQANLGPQSTAADAQPYFNCLAQAGYRTPASSSSGNSTTSTGSSSSTGTGSSSTGTGSSSTGTGSTGASTGLGSG